MLRATVPAVVAHDSALTGPHDLLGAWSLDPLIVVPLGLLALLYRSGFRRPDGRRRALAFATGLLALTVALVSPLDALAGELASAHMVQHVLLVVVAAPLLAASAPTAALLRGVPARLRPALWASLRTTGLDRGWLQAARSPIGRWLAYVATIWAWHASVLYDAAVEHDAVHALEHLMFLATAWLVWSSIVGPRRSRLPPGLGVLGTFTLALQSVFLAALLTFARTPWYQPYTATAPRWGLEPLADQQLAGVIMWIPAGLAHTAIGVVLLALWLHDIESAASAPAPPLSSQPPSGSPAPGARDAG